MKVPSRLENALKSGVIQASNWRREWCLYLYAAYGWAAFAQPAITPGMVLNDASRAAQCAPNGGIAQGSRFVIHGQGLGPVQEALQSEFPLVTELAGTSVAITINGSTVAAFPLSVSANRIVAMAPSEVAIGTGAVTVTYQSRSSSPAPIRTVARTFGLYTVNRKGMGAADAKVRDGDQISVTGIAAPVRAGQRMMVTGTGLGAVSAEESLKPLPGEPAGASPKVWIGPREATVFSAGRSECCAGLDQIEFEVPAEVIGCAVPIAVEVDGIYSNYGTVAIAGPNDASCPNPPVPAPEAVDKPISLGSVALFVNELAAPGIGSLQLAGGGASFERIAPIVGGVDVLRSLRQFFSSSDLGPSLSCSIIAEAEFNPEEDYLNTTRSGLDAGAEVRVKGPRGERVLTPSDKGQYQFEVASPADFFTDGTYTISNGAGGADVGPFSLDLRYIAARLTTSIPARIPRDQDFTVRWAVPSGAPDAFMVVEGSSLGQCGKQQVSFSCAARLSSGQLTIPARILKQLPVSESSSGSPGGSIGVVSFPASGFIKRFDAKGLDLGIGLAGFTQAFGVNFQ